jgi:hypothetical protein
MSEPTVTRSSLLPDRDEEAWNALVPPTVAGFYLSHQWLASLRGPGHDGETWVGHGEDGAACLVPAYRTETIDNPRYDLGLLFGADLPGARWTPQAILGARAGYANTPLVARDEDLALWAATARKAAEHVASAAIAYLDARSATALTAHLPSAFTLLTGARCEISLHPGDDWDRHLARLPASRRALIRRDLRTFAAGPSRITVAPLTPDLASRLAPLLVNVQVRHSGHGSLTGAADYLRGCAADGLAAHSVAFLCWDGPDITGFVIGYRHGPVLTLRVAGLDYERTRDHAEYFTLLVHEPVRHALAAGLRAVDLGTEGYRTKLLRGAHLVPLCTVLLAHPDEFGSDQAETHNRRAADRLIAEYGDLDPTVADALAAFAMVDRPSVAMSLR